MQNIVFYFKCLLSVNPLPSVPTPLNILNIERVKFSDKDINEIQ